MEKAHIASTVELVIPWNRPYTHGGFEFLENGNQLIIRWPMAFEDVPEQNHDIGLMFVYLSNPGCQPFLAELRAEMHIGKGNEHRPIQCFGQAGEAHLIGFNHWRTQPLEKSYPGKDYTSQQSPASQRRRYLRH